jgi:hypothetical protein
MVGLCCSYVPNANSSVGRVLTVIWAKPCSMLRNKLGEVAVLENYDPGSVSSTNLTKSSDVASLDVDAEELQMGESGKSSLKINGCRLVGESEAQ